ncbi:hypothetical protein [Aeromicrobium sp.]
MPQPQKRHPVRKLVLLLLMAAAVVAFRNAVADKGGSYDPAEAGTR